MTVNPGMRSPKALTMGKVMEWSPPRHTGRRSWSRSSPTLDSIAAKGVLEVEFQIARVAIRAFGAEIDAAFCGRVRGIGAEGYANDGRRSRRSTQP